MVQLRCGVVSITGDYRENNEDRVAVDQHNRYFLVADGMGGQSAGEKASEIAVDVITQRLEQSLNFDNEDEQEVLRGIDAAVEAANSEIMALGEVEASYRNMGTTIVLCVRAGESLYIGGIGDSRAYQLRDRTLTQLTTDHSLTQALLDAGTITEDEAANHRYKNVLYRYLGTKEGGTGTHARRLEPLGGDRYLLCSDGVTDGLSHEKLCELLQSGTDCEQTAQSIVAAAQTGGSKDNISCIVIEVA